jgi:hypothetical protein
VHYSHEWGRSDVDLHFEPLKIPGGTSVENFELRMHDLWPVDGLPDVHRFDAGQVLPGRYLLKSYACRFQQLIETGPDGTDHAEIVIGDPADVVVRIVDADNGSPLQSPISLYWICKRPAESTGGVFEGCEWDESIHAARLRAPAGEIELGVSSELGLDYEVVGSNVIQARPGSNEATLRLRAANTIVLKPTVDGTEAKWPVDDDGRVSMTKLVAADDSEAEVTIHNLSEEALDFFVPKPGRYIVRVVAPKGFDAVASFEVEARKGARVVAVVALHRSR